MNDALASALVILLPTLLAVVPLLAVLRGAPPMFDDADADAVDVDVDAAVTKKESAPMRNLFSASRAGLNLSPAERAILKLLESLAVAFGVAALPVIADVLSTHANVDWAATLHNAVLLGAAAVALALVKYFKAQGDSPLLGAVEDALSNAAAALTAQAGLNEPVHEPDPTPPTPPTDSPASASLPRAA